MGVFKKKRVVSLFLATALFVAGFYFFYSPANGLEPGVSPYPFGRNFAFTVTDDPDNNRLQRVMPVYEFLTDIGLRTTVAVWPRKALRNNGLPDVQGDFDKADTLEDAKYREYIVGLEKRGFEIAMHTASWGNDKREETIQAYDDFKRIFGYYPKMNIMHSKNLEDIYWGAKVLNNRLAKWLLSDIVGAVVKKAAFPFSGEAPESEYFWGDISRERTRFVRLWGTRDINTLKYNPSMPYHDPGKPYVNYWFSFSDGYNAGFFYKLISDRNIEKLVRERGAAIVYTHFSPTFTKKDSSGNFVLDQYFKEQMKKIAGQREGWFVPASVMLERFLAIKNIGVFSTESAVVITNSNAFPVEGLTILLKPDAVLYGNDGREFRANDEGEIIINEMGAGASATLFRRKDELFVNRAYPGRLESLNLVLQRAVIWLFSHSK